MNILITGADGFIAKNLISVLRRRDNTSLLLLTRSNEEELDSFIKKADFIYHLAGVNRPKESYEFYEGNSGLTERLVSLLQKYQKNTPILLSSSTQAEVDNDYGKSKLQSEEAVLFYSKQTGAQIFIYRLPNVFGKWSKPNYNTVIATWCYNITHDLPVNIDNPKALLSLVYIDDVVNSFAKHLQHDSKPSSYYNIELIYHKNLEEITFLLFAFKKNRSSLEIPQVGTGFERALYATYLSFLDPNDFSYTLNGFQDDRGTFYEVLKTVDSGQFSLSTTKPGITRGNHYHDTKNEKFLVIKGHAIIEHRHILNDEVITYEVSDKKIEIVEMIPGYTHNITNTGDTDLVLLIWANEQFDRKNTDTYFLKV